LVMFQVATSGRPADLAGMARGCLVCS
jgi:hypothetical protein